MKKGALIIGALLFSLLFYKQDIGLNQFLFTLITVGILSIHNYSKIKKRSTIILVMIYIISGLTVFFYRTNLNVIVNIICFFTLIGSYSENKSSIYIKWINGIYSAIVSTFSHYYEGLNSEDKNIKKKEVNYQHWFKIIGIPAVIIIIFTALYRKGNPLFNDIISKIDFSFINFQWILLAGLGYYLFNNITKPIQIEPITVIDKSTGNQLIKNSLNIKTNEVLESEKQLGIILISLLNVLITFFLVTDVYSLLHKNNFTAYELSTQVHSGTNTLIISIILAIAIIIYFFRSDLNFYSKNKQLKTLTFIWIFLNVILAFITTYKNYQYSSIYGFTYRRIGVFVYLFLTLFGLITTYIKVNKINNLWYLLRKNTQIAFLLLAISTTINWDKIITYYNLNYAETLDINYLMTLTDNNTFLLKDYAEKNAIDNSFKYEIGKRHSEYISHLEASSWQEMIFDNINLKE